MSTKNPDCAKTQPSLRAAPPPTQEQLRQIAANDAANAVQVVNDATEVAAQVAATLTPVAAPVSGIVSAAGPRDLAREREALGLYSRIDRGSYRLPDGATPEVIAVSAAVSEGIAHRVRRVAAQVEPIEEAPLAQRRPSFAPAKSAPASSKTALRRTQVPFATVFVPSKK